MRIKTVKVLAYLFFYMSVGTLIAQTTGTISGTVVDSQSNVPLSFANVVLKGTSYGAFTLEDGKYHIERVPAGQYTLLVSYIGYQTFEAPVAVVAGQEVTVEVKMQLEVIELTGTEVTAARKLIERTLNSTTRVTEAEEIDQLPVEDVTELLQLQAGVTLVDEELSIRGSRSTETDIIVDGVSTRDPLVGGGTTLQVASGAIEQIQIKTGGFSAEFGEATAGHIQVRTRDGGDEFEGKVRYKTDALFGETKEKRRTIEISPGDSALIIEPARGRGFNTDIVEFTLSGPLTNFVNKIYPFGNSLPGRLNFLISAKTSLSDTYLPNVESLKTERFGPSLSPRQDNEYFGLFKLTYRPSQSTTIRASFIRSIDIEQGFFRNTNFTIGSQNTSPSGFDYSFYGGLAGKTDLRDNANSFTFENSQSNLEYTKVFDFKKQSMLKVQLSRFFTSVVRDVQGKGFSEYEPLFDFDNDGFFDVGDDRIYHNRFADRYALDVSYERNYGQNHFGKFGGEVAYQEIQFVTIEDPAQNPTGLGRNTDIFRVFPVTGFFYAQDTIDFLSLIIDVGVRLDYWFPGSLVDRVLRNRERPEVFEESLVQNYFDDTVGIFGHRAKLNLSPRVAISHPISDRDVFFFNFGVFVKRPEFQRVYSRLTIVGPQTTFSFQGNPNLDPERTVTFEFGVRHIFTDEIIAGITFFNRDSFDFETLTNVQPSDPSLPSFFTYVNSDFARNRGVEVQFEQRRLKNLSTKLDFSFTIGKGKTNTNVEGFNAVRIGRDVDLSEDFLSFNRPVRATFTADYRFEKNENLELFGITFPDRWSANVVYDFTSGKRYTPRDPLNLSRDFPQFSELGPSRQNLNLTVTKWFNFGGERTTIGLEIRNLLDRKNVRRVNPITGDAVSEDDLIRGNFDPDVFGTSFERALDPSRFESPRQITLFVEQEF